jgi:protein-tyrosine-phosphatase
VLTHNPVLDRLKVPDSNVFFMTRFRATDYHQEISETVQYHLESYGLEFIRADDTNWAAATLWDRVRFCIEASRSGIAVFETFDETDINPNVSLELGYMMALGRPCLLLKEKRLKALPSDLCGHLYKEFDSRDISRTIGNRTREWLQEIGVRKRSGERLIVFVSIGGTCRCAIAMAITRLLLEPRKEAAHVRVESRAIQRPDHDSAMKSGRLAVETVLGRDLLVDHRPRNAGAAFLQEADLILAMDTYVLDEIRNIHLEHRGPATDQSAIQREIAAKLFLVTEFFGSSGSVSDPYPDEEDPASVRKYEECVRNLRRLIEPNTDRLLTYLRDRRAAVRSG